MNFSRQQLKSLAVGHPEDLVLIPNAVLMDLYRDAISDEQLQGNCLAELYCRWYVGDSGRLRTEEQFLHEQTPGGIPPRLLGLRTEQDLLCEEEMRGIFASPLWECDDASAAYIESVVRERLCQLMTKVDGFVPVYHMVDGGAGLFLPFEIIPHGGGRAPSAIDMDGRIIKNWNKPAHDILGSDWQLHVFYSQGNGLPTPTGRSFLLPLQVALWRKLNEVPRFNPWQLLFTGDIDVAGRAVPVKTEEKEAGVKARFQRDVRLVAPSDSPYASETSGIDPIPSGFAGERLLDAVRTRIEQLRKCRFSPAYARNRLPNLEHEIRQQAIGDWQRQIDRVDAMLRVLGRHVSPREYLRLLMLKGEAFCHSGMTSAALRENTRALKFAREKGLAFEELRLEIEQFVEFQDSQRFDEIAKLARPLLSRINKADVTDHDRLDLQMRYYGTMGQILMEKCLLGLDQTKAGQAKSSIEKAVGCARALQSLGDEIQDLNYLHLWYGLFDPASEEFDELDGEIENLIPTLEIEGERVKNLAFFRRQQMVSAYMEWRLTGTLPDRWKLLKELPEGSYGHLIASTMKMKGALAAAAGEVEMAKACFATGDENFPYEDWWGHEGDPLSDGPVLAQIRMALLTQAICSLAELGLNAEVDDYKGKLRKLFERCPSLIRRIGAADCQSTISTKQLPAPRTLPAFYY